MKEYSTTYSCCAKRKIVCIKCGSRSIAKMFKYVNYAVNYMELCWPGLMAVVYDWNYFCSKFHHHQCTASSGIVSLKVRRTLLKIPYTDGGKTSSRNDFNHRPWRSTQTTEIHVTIPAIKAYVNLCCLRYKKNSNMY